MSTKSVITLFCLLCGGLLVVWLLATEYASRSTSLEAGMENKRAEESERPALKVQQELSIGGARDTFDRAQAVERHSVARASVDRAGGDTEASSEWLDLLTEQSLPVEPEEVHVIGPYKDPDDPAAWSDDSTEVHIIGEYKDPDDPATWSADSPEVHVIGEYKDLDDPGSWSSDADAEVHTIGPYKDPDDPANWPAALDTGIRNVGPYIDPNDPETWR